MTQQFYLAIYFKKYESIFLQKDLNKYFYKGFV